jgi:hypothetical protein
MVLTYDRESVAPPGGRSCEGADLGSLGSGSRPGDGSEEQRGHLGRHDCGWATQWQMWEWLLSSFTQVVDCLVGGDEMTG